LGNAAKGPTAGRDVHSSALEANGIGVPSLYHFAFKFSENQTYPLSEQFGKC